METAGRGTKRREGKGTQGFDRAQCATYPCRDLQRPSHPYHTSAPHPHHTHTTPTTWSWCSVGDRTSQCLSARPVRLCLHVAWCCGQLPAFLWNARGTGWCWNNGPRRPNRAAPGSRPRSASTRGPPKLMRLATAATAASRSSPVSESARGVIVISFVCAAVSKLIESLGWSALWVPPGR